MPGATKNIYMVSLCARYIHNFLYCMHAYYSGLGKYYCILLRLRRSFKISIGFGEASCPSQWSYPYWVSMSDIFSSLVDSPKLTVPRA